MACGELYRHQACGDAWRRELKLADEAAKRTAIDPTELPDARRIVAACAAAYCADLAAKPGACKGLPSPIDNAAQVAALDELDTAILNFELRDPALAAVLARRSRVFGYLVVPTEAKSLNAGDAAPVKPVKVELMADGTARLDGKPIDLEQLESEAAKLGSHGEIRATIAAEPRVEHGRVVHTLDLLRRAGVKKIAFAVSPAASLEPASP